MWLVGIASKQKGYFIFDANNFGEVRNPQEVNVVRFSLKGKMGLSGAIAIFSTISC